MRFLITLTIPHHVIMSFDYPRQIIVVITYQETGEKRREHIGYNRYVRVLGDI